MNKFAALVFLLLVADSLAARERPITSCEKAPLLAEFQDQLPDHILAASADKKHKLVSELPRFAVPILRRSGSNLVCVVIVLDAQGKVQDLAVSYPAGFALTSREKNLIFALRWSAAEVAGEARPSLTNMDFEFR